MKNFFKKVAGNLQKNDLLITEINAKRSNEELEEFLRTGTERGSLHEPIRLLPGIGLRRQASRDAALVRGRESFRARKRRRRCA